MLLYEKKPNMYQGNSLCKAKTFVSCSFLSQVFQMLIYTDCNALSAFFDVGTCI